MDKKEKGEVIKEIGRRIEKHESRSVSHWDWWTFFLLTIWIVFIMIIGFIVYNGYILPQPLVLEHTEYTEPNVCEFHSAAIDFKGDCSLVDKYLWEVSELHQCNEWLSEAKDDLRSCNHDLEEHRANLTAASKELGECKDELGKCDVNLAYCEMLLDSNMFEDFEIEYVEVDS
jgi:hypothetical protein